MTLWTLAAAWVVLTLLVAPVRNPVLGRLPPRVQALAALLAAGALAVIPVSAASVVLAGRLTELGGARWSGCGRLIRAIVTQPLAAPELTLAMAIVLLAPIGLLLGTLAAWRSQAPARVLARGSSGEVVVLASEHPIALTVGLVRPRVVLSQRLLTLPEAHRRVVLAHEEAHRRGRHPAFLLAVEAIARGFPLAPVRWAADAFRFALEAIADERAVAETGDRALVAETVAHVALTSVGSAPAFEGSEVRRVRRLMAPTPQRWLLSAVALVGVLFLVFGFASGHAVHCAAASLDQASAVQCRLHRAR